MADAVGTSEAPPNPPKSLWDSGLGRSLQPSCYGSLVASTSSCSSAFEFSQRMQKSESGCGFAEAPKFQYDVADDLRSLKERLRCAALFDSTVSAAASEMQSVLERSANANYGTGWMLAEEMSEASSDDDSWDGYMEVGDKRLKVREMADVLASRFAFISGLRTHEGYSIVTFPDSHCQVSFDDYHLLITYLLKVPPLEETHKGYVLIIDRRMDKWSSVRTLFQFITSFFPDPLRVVFLLKPEGVLQRALEVGYRSFVDNFKYKVIVCQNSLELRHFVAADRLTMDVGGLLKYNHLEWVQHRMDIERMKSSAAVIAESLSEFGRCLKETELPNDVETTERILEVQTAEHDAIKEDFRISIRKGLSLLRQVRQFETKPEHEQLSPTRLHNVTAIERMLVQLEDTERSFDVFWTKHLHKLTQCLQLRRFEDSFRKLQTDFTRHLLYLEEHREVGDGVERVEALTESHREYTAAAMEDVAAARALKDAGDELLSTKDTEIAGSLVPKCSELGRMADALASALDRRAQVLRLSENMHRQIAEANQWCKRGVDLLSATPFEMNQSTASSALSRIEGFIADGDSLQLDALKGKSDANNLILLTTTETSTLLAQVAERIDDIRRMSAARRDALQKFALQEKEKPVQVVSPEKTQRSVDTSPSKSSPGSSARHLVDVALVHGHRSASALCSSASSGEVASTACSRSHSVSSPIDSPSNERASTIANFVLAELLTTEQTYVRELQSLVEYYVNPFEAPENQHLISPAIRGRSDLVFGNLRELYEFHNKFLLKEIVKSSDCVLDICHCLVSQRNRFLGLYLPYCQNKSVSEVLRREHVDGTKFFLECQKRAGHPLPLSAYLLKPIQRITKYQLLLKELAAHCSEDIRRDVQSSLDSMLHLLSTLNGAMNQLHISGYAGDLSLLGPLRLQTECEVYAFKKKTHRLNKAQRRHLFLFEGGILFCKQRTQPVPYAPEYYEHKISIVMRNLGFAECSKACPDRFEIWDVNKTDGYAVFALDERARQKWIQKLSRMTARLPVPLAAQGPPERNRPQSWTSTVSSDSNTSRSSIDEFAPSSTSIQTFTTTSSKTDANGNDRADEKGSALDGDSEDLADRLDNNSAHVTTIQIPLSKSLQNCEIADSLEASAIEAVNQPSQLLAQ
ncbi:hypothetical protein QR680_017481 [Steinernema hermaphroditum]|uniref:DH domain-containing protein n=1 Tax=Steinernema hermaphroditum TaxID=289476 RepID=A0AA39HFB9_9BILA|nr:hypothetical protein QR680_017481 [Steinernema hermaphroditum]